MGLIQWHVLDNLLFHLEEWINLKQSWFERVNEFHALELKTRLSIIVPNEHASIEQYLAQFRSLLSQLKVCCKEKNEVGSIFLILSKLKGPFEVFSFTFYATRDVLGDSFKIANIETFCDHLM